MTERKPGNRPGDEQVPGERELRSAYANESRPEPSPELDAAVLRTARQAIDDSSTSKRSRFRLGHPFAWAGTAAVAVLALGLVFQASPPEPELPPAASPPAKAQSLGGESSSLDRVDLHSRDQASDEEFREISSLPGARVEQDQAMPAESQLEAEEFIELRSDADLRVRKEASARDGDESEAAIRVLEDVAGEPARFADAEVVPEPGQWIEQLRLWRSLPDQEAVFKSELAAFRAAYPEYALPADLVEVDP